MTPTFEISIDGNVIDFADRVIALTVTNQSPDRFVSETSDSVEIELEDTQPVRLALPPRGRELRVKIGYAGQPLVDKGTYIVDEVEIDGPPDRLIIRAQSNPKSPHDEKYNSFTTRQTRSYPAPLTIQQLVETIAKAHGMEAVVSADLASISLPQVDQTNQSDMDVLQRQIVFTYDAAIKLEDGKLIVVKRAVGETVSGAKMPDVQVTRAQPGEALDPAKLYLSRWRAKFSDFVTYATAIAAWHDMTTGKDEDEQAGSGAEPVLRLTHLYSNSAEASAAAKSALFANDRRAGEVEVALPGAPQITAWGTLTVVGVRDGIDGSWWISQVVNRIDRGGFVTSVAAEILSSDLLDQTGGN